MGFEVMEEFAATGLGYQQRRSGSSDQCVFGECGAEPVMVCLARSPASVHGQLPCGTIEAGCGLRNFSSVQLRV